MKNKQNIAFGIGSLLVAVAAAISSFFAFKNSTILGIVCLLISAFALVCLAGIIVAQRYVEGCIVRYIIYLGGSATRNQLDDRYAQMGAIDSELETLAVRKVISIKDSVISVHESELNSGLLNSIMMWTTRKLYQQ